MFKKNFMYIINDKQESLFVDSYNYYAILNFSNNYTDLLFASQMLKLAFFKLHMKALKVLKDANQTPPSDRTRPRQARGQIYITWKVQDYNIEMASEKSPQSF